MVIFFWFPETKGLSLEEISLIFDGNEAQSHQAAVEADFMGKADVEHIENLNSSKNGFGSENV